MARVLVVDDSAVDRRLVAGLLGADNQLQLDYAENGREALRRLHPGNLPDLVLTDMVMPEMDGLELVAAVKEKFRLLPVILMTSQGSEEIAVQALQRGAASYVPKRLLGRELLTIVRRVLALACQQHSHAALMKCLTRNEFTFELHNDTTLIPPLINYVQANLALAGLCDASERLRVGVALEEALLNAVLHGNLEVDSKLREKDDAEYYQEADRRRGLAPYRERRVRFRAAFSPEEARFTVEDEGPGFNPADVPDPTDPANLEKTSGRGILLMRLIMDDVQYNARGNQVVLVKRRDEPSLESAQPLLSGHQQ
jgi:CheY-like chemotaxis protein/anti-sigma regulatory factor (Ser/Thr protein kinase)